MLTITFADSPDRPKAFGIFAAIAGGSASVGLILGGALTQVLSWRWCLYINLAIAIPTALISLRLLVNHADPARPKIDVPGALTGSGGLFALVYGFSNAETNSWSAALTIISLVASSVLLASFVLIERRVAHRCCHCTSSGTGPAVAPSPRSCSRASASLRCFCSSPTSCRRT